MARFFWVIRLYARNGCFVIIDDHTEDLTVVDDPGTWLQVSNADRELAMQAVSLSAFALHSCRQTLVAGIPSRPGMLCAI